VSYSLLDDSLVDHLVFLKLQYYDVLIDFPFKGDDAALRAMEHAELISITTHEGELTELIYLKPG